LGDLGIDGGILFNWMLKKYNVSLCLDSYSSKYGTVAGYYENVNETADFREG
jgi:hypothetical protein